MIECVHGNERHDKIRHTQSAGSFKVHNAVFREALLRSEDQEFVGIVGSSDTGAVGFQVVGKVQRPLSSVHLVKQFFGP